MIQYSLDLHNKSKSSFCHLLIYVEAKFLHPVIEVKMFGTNLESHPLLNAEYFLETYLLESTQIKMVELVMNNDPG